MAPRFPFRSTIILGVAGILAVALPLLLMKSGVIDPYTTRILTMGGVNAIMAMSVNMIVGITGQLSLGQAGFLAIGAYSCIFFSFDMGLPLPLAALCAVIVTTFVGFLIGFPVLKLTGDYLAIVTLGFGEIIRIVFINLKTLTGGPNGKTFAYVEKSGKLLYNPMFYLPDNHWLKKFLSEREFAFIVTTIMLVIILALLQNFLRSSYGRAIKACREDEIAANANGITIFRYKMIGFVIAAFIAGIGGCFFAMVNGFVKPDAAQFLRSIDYLIYVVLGGMGSMTGSILSAYVLTYLQEFLRFLQEYRLLIYPVILILVMLFRPKGLLGMKEFSIVGFVDRLIAIRNRKLSPAKK